MNAVQYDVKNARTSAVTLLDRTHPPVAARQSTLVSDACIEALNTTFWGRNDLQQIAFGLAFCSLPIS
jgi:hypothetical protein